MGAKLMLATILLVLTVGALGCTRGADPLAGPGDPGSEPMGSVVSGLLVTVEYHIFPSADGLEDLYADVEVTNIRGSQFTAGLGGCPWWFRAYTTAKRSGDPLWRREDLRLSGARPASTSSRSLLGNRGATA